ncbi:hypothetical protein [Moorena bouillonii]|uniref:hypothetical protein n=1 Tax=Moorena bouillonii TaxID=207920 RepID=UPI001180D0C4|nr:hypothetical protein [Moorena bouillonii]
MAYGHATRMATLREQLSASKSVPSCSPSVRVAHMLTSQFPGLLAFWPRYANGHATRMPKGGIHSLWL